MILLYAVNTVLTSVKESGTTYTLPLRTNSPKALIPGLGLQHLFSDNRYVTIAIPLAVVKSADKKAKTADKKGGVELRPTFVSLVDDDAMGDEVIRKLERHKVNTKYMRKVKDGMGTWLAVFDHKGDVVASISKRPNHQPVEDILDEYGDEIFKDADSIVIEIDTDREIVKKTFHYAEKYNKKVYAIVSNMTIAVERRDFLRRTSCFVCNHQEAGILFSEDYSDVTPEEMTEILAERIASAQIPQMVVTMGSKGAVFAGESGEKGFHPALKVDVVDTTCAGDSFFAGVCIGLTYGKNLKESCEIGTRLASTVITTSESVCPRACLKNHSCNLHAPIHGIFCFHSVDAARYAVLIQAKSPANCDAHLAESIFQTHSRVTNMLYLFFGELSLAGGEIIIYC